MIQVTSDVRKLINRIIKIRLVEENVTARLVSQLLHLLYELNNRLTDEFAWLLNEQESDSPIFKRGTVSGVIVDLRLVDYHINQKNGVLILVCTQRLIRSFNELKSNLKQNNKGESY